MSKTNGLSSTKKLLEGLIKPEGVYDGAKILEIVKRLNQEAANSTNIEEMSPILKNLGYSNEFRATLIKFLKLLRVIWHDMGEDVWCVVPVNVAEVLLQPTLIEITHNEIKQSWNTSNVVRRLKKKNAELEERIAELEVQTKERSVKKRGAARRSVSRVGTDFPATKAELRAFVLEVLEEEEMKKK